ncbi:hypothetical protein B0T21DRAFT_295304 [Apiosordaria backusii]|uniref:Ricin B lectin n=1 Tax=Apiosordaria backusii TaxID=314023 RepID=A0AA40ANL5_9PEZI|nr:hypothetical protein B0T21DRAFT_295304 [Apiosordaria backusii]
MRLLLQLFTLLWAYTSFATAAINWRLQKATNPTSDQNDAYARIENAMRLAAARYNRLAPRANKEVTVQYVPSVQTADGNFNGNIRFGSNRSYMNERTALHEISHTLGIGTTNSFNQRCSANNWPTATPLLKSWDGQSAKINCGGGHIWPYGLNYDNEWSETNANRHCQLINAMLADGLAS